MICAVAVLGGLALMFASLQVARTVARASAGGQEAPSSASVPMGDVRVAVI